MSPEERQLLVNLFERTKPAADSPRDHDAERLIEDALRAQPHAAYYLAQAVIVQEKAVETAAARIRDLEERLRELEARHGPDTDAPRQSQGGFLGGLGALFGAEAPRNYRSEPAPQAWPRQNNAQDGRQGQVYDDYARNAPAARPGPWSQVQAQPQFQPQAQIQPGPWSPGFAGGGGSFLRSALGTAAGVAGGVLIADAVQDLFSSSHATTAASALGATAPVEETIINNYYGDDRGASDQRDTAPQDDGLQQADYQNDGGMDDPADMGDGSYDV